MPGPLPKNPEIKQRRNKASSRALLPVDKKTYIEKPPLPPLSGKRKWHPMAEVFWQAVWESPMRSAFVHGDEPALYRLLYLVDRYWKKGSLEVAKEIRLMEREFGLTPLSRRRLEWTIAQAEEAKDKHEINRARRAKKLITLEGDPRGVLDQ
jgi:hypothetical protein